MNITIDLGNTSAKIVVFEKENIISSEILPHTEKKSEQKIQEKIAALPGEKHIILSSVVGSKAELIGALRAQGQFLELHENTPLPFENQYASKATLGNDRVAAIAGAYNIFPQTNVLVIDIGTAITYDFIDLHARYFGGNISPGIDLRFKALHTYTQNLPLVSKQQSYNPTGTDTHSAIVAGVQQGVLFELKAYIARFSQKYSGCKTILTGGDAFFFAKKLKKTIFAEPNLVAIGLNSILQFNLQKKHNNSL